MIKQQSISFANNDRKEIEMYFHSKQEEIAQASTLLEDEFIQEQATMEDENFSYLDDYADED